MVHATPCLRNRLSFHYIAVICAVVLTIVQPDRMIAQDEGPIPLCGGFHTEHVPDGSYNFVDRFNRPWSAPAHLIAGHKPQASLQASCSIFRIEFEDVILGNGIGFDDPTPVNHPVLGATTLGAVRRQTVCEVFRYIENTISVNGTPDVLIAESYTIRTGFIAAASSFYQSGLPDGFAGGTMYDHITSGTDPTPTPGDFDAFMVFSFGYDMHDDWNSAPGTSIDLYSVALHEATHTLGFASLIGANGSSKIGGPYSRFDRLLRNASDAPLIDPALYTFIGTQADLVSDKINFHGDNCPYPSPVYSDAAFQPGSSLSHFDGIRSGIQYVMRPSTAGGSDRTLMAEELRVLCELGYQLQNNGCSGCIPAGRLDLASTEPGIKICVDVLANDRDPDGNQLSIDPGSIRIEKGTGTVSIEGDLLCFTPDPNFTGVAIIIYRPLNGRSSGDETRLFVSVVRQHLFSSCETDSLLIRTGWDFENDRLEDYGAATSYWTIVSDPNQQTIEPRPAITTYTYSGWREPLPSSRWISAAGPTATVRDHGKYHFEMQFCLGKVPNELRLILDYLVDDRGTVLVNDVVVGTSRNGYAFRDPTLYIDTNIAPFVHPGRNTITLIADNSGGVAMGVNAAGYLLPDEPTIFRCNAIRISDDIEICRGSSTSLLAQGGLSYRWTPEKGLSCAECPDPTASPDQTTTYHVQGLDSNGCLFEESVQVVVTENDVDAGPDQQICPGYAVQLNATGGSSYRWSPSAGLSCTDCADPVASPTSTRTYYVVGTDPSGCNGLDSVTIRILDDCIDTGRTFRICREDTVQLSAADWESYQWSPTDGLSCSDCPAPSAYPDKTTFYKVTGTTRDGSQVADSVAVIVEDPTILHVRATQFKEQHQTNSLTIPVLLVDRADGLNITQLRFELQYDPYVLSIDPASVTTHMKDRLLQGWDVLYKEESQGKLVIVFTAPNGAELTGSGELLVLEASLYLSTHPESELVIRLESLGDDACVEFQSENSLIRPEICGGSLRLIELASGKYALGPATPNPSTSRVTIPFSLGLDGPTRLDIIDMHGAHATTLINSDLDTGEYEVELDGRTLPPGTYFYRLRSGAWEQTGRMVLVR